MSSISMRPPPPLKQIDLDQYETRIKRVGGYPHEHSTKKEQYTVFIQTAGTRVIPTRHELSAYLGNHKSRVLRGYGQRVGQYGQTVTGQRHFINALLYAF
ncbi:hypothetical protein MSG28_015087 [Choristoneura fumiferana]|uniref:Uncharacterized protein n=1 Tax=Choristoneura fumiferana TaxID=7141 RepID=A0ACC0KYC4_CHOFU|nr:hypothetical protein MSG28_015087 [Choristoneura fumiferana]